MNVESHQSQIDNRVIVTIVLPTKGRGMSYQPANPSKSATVGRRRPLKIALFLTALVFGLIWIGVGSTSLVTTSSSVRQSRFVSLTSDGHVLLDDGTRIRLIGIQMRSDEETGEPDLLTIISRIVTSCTEAVSIHPHGESSGIVKYQQRIYYRDRYKFWGIGMIGAPQSIEVSINELLIAMGAARLDSSASMLPMEYQRSLIDIQMKSASAWGKVNGYTPLESLDPMISSYIYRSGKGFRVRLSKGDVELWKYRNQE